MGYRSLFFLVGLIFGSLSAFGQSAEGQVVELARESELLQRYRFGTGQESLLVEIRKTPVQIRLENEKGYSGHVISIYRPESGLFWWRFVPGKTSSNNGLVLNTSHVPWFLYFSAEESTVFCFLGSVNPRITFLRSRERYPTINAAYRRLATTLESSRGSLKRFPRSGGTFPWLNIYPTNFLGDPTMHPFELLERSRMWSAGTLHGRLK